MSEFINKSYKKLRRDFLPFTFPYVDLEINFKKSYPFRGDVKDLRKQQFGTGT